MSWLLNWLKSFFAPKPQPSKFEAVKPSVPAKVEPKPVAKKTPAWMIFLRSKIGMHETNPVWAKFMVPKWIIVGLRLDRIDQSWAAWCGSMVGVALAVSIGLSVEKTWFPGGGLASTWGHRYGTVINWKVDGIPEGATVHINHKFNCDSSSGNHVAFANGDCAPQDIIEMVKGADGVWKASRNPAVIKKGATIDLLGGNQNNSVRVATYDAREICNVRWADKPKDVEAAKKWTPYPGKVTESLNCTSKVLTGGSTR